ncbi:MAG: hypothetical protein CME13_09505 [Gemmatimonadetes bacterium]|nr:hypothetical protein [Gemmatimonadota bacterium]HCV26524.1 hypothetical protein [Candidatus Latescibacterota bacterium]
MVTDLTSLSPNLWVTEEPLKLGPARLNHRMTVVRLSDGRLWVHSPVAYTDELSAALAELGDVTDLVAPSIFHDLHWNQWRGQYPEARFHAPVGLPHRGGSRVQLSARGRAEHRHSNDPDHDRGQGQDGRVTPVPFHDQGRSRIPTKSRPGPRHPLRATDRRAW